MLVVNCREPKTLNDTQYLHLHLIWSETADMRPQHVVFTCGLKNTVKASFLKVEPWRVQCKGEIWRCLMDIPSCLGTKLCPAAPALPSQPLQSRQLQRAPEVSPGCTDWAAQPKQDGIWNSVVSVRANGKQDAATAQPQRPKFCSQLWPGEPSYSSGNLHSVVL